MSDTTGGSPLLTIQGLKIEAMRDGVWSSIARDVSFSVNRGEVLGLIGESGAGKSTVGLAAMAYTRPGCRIAEGSIIFDGQDLRKASPSQKVMLWGNRIAYVAQSAAASFNPAYRLLDQTIETAVYWRHASRKDADADAKRLYREMQLPTPDTLGERFPHQVSGGQLQRIMTAMAMTCRPDLIIFDEPTTALDVSTQREVLIAMRHIVSQHGTAAIYISHDLAVVAQMADRIAVMRSGEIVEQAPTREIMATPKHEYTKSLWAVRSLATSEKPAGESLLEVTDARVVYGENVALHDVSITVPRRTTVALVGESGSGKTTLGRMIAGLIPRATGRILFNGTPIPAYLPERAGSVTRKIQLIYQSADTALNPRHTVSKIIGRPLSFYHDLNGREQRERVIELLETVKLGPEHLDRYPPELSGGQKQRVAIARAIAAEPDLIICDEVTSALDQIVQEEILKLLTSLQETTGVSYLFITHDIATVRAIADQVVVMHAGKVIEQGPKSKVLSPPYKDYTNLLLSSVPEMDPDWLDKQIHSKAASQ